MSPNYRPFPLSGIVAWRLCAAMLLSVLLVPVLGCGSNEVDAASDQQGSVSVTSRGEVRREIRKVEESAKRTGGGKYAFCRQRWRGPQVAQSAAAKLLADRATVVPGGYLYVLIENVGTATLNYGGAPKVAQLAHGQWYPREFVRNGVPIVFPGVSLELKPRATSSCLRVPASDTWRPGLYRVSFVVEASENRGADSALLPTAYFRVKEAPDASR